MMPLLSVTQQNFIGNIPELIGCLHSNPIRMSLTAQVFVILALTVVMAIFNYQIRHKDKRQYYPVLYTLFFLSLVSIYYYCFNSQFPIIDNGFGAVEPNLAWFCAPHLVGWLQAIVGGIALVFVIYNVLCAVMQVTAEMTLRANMDKMKKWKEWKLVSGFVLFACVIICLIQFIAPQAVRWALVAFLVLLLAAVVAKAVSDIRHCNNVLYPVLISLTYLAGIIAVAMLTIGCLYSFSVLLLFLVFIFSRAKASRKNVTPDKK